MKGHEYSSEEERGRAYVERWRSNPKLLSELLGNFYDTSSRGIFLRRLLMAMNINPRWLEKIGHWIVSSFANEKWSAFRQQYSFWWAVRRAVGDRAIWQRLTQGVPILMYHAFGRNGETASRYVLPIRKFSVQMWLLKRLNYHVISLEEYLKFLSDSHLPPERSIIITIDDGYKDNYSLAYAVLKRFGFQATIFLVSHHLGKTNQWDKNSVLTGRVLVDQREAKEMQRDAISFGSHTCTHPFLTKLSEQKIQEEICQSKVDLEQSIGIPIRLFSYPYGDYDPKVAAAVQGAGFEAACTTDLGLNMLQTSVFILHRTEIFGTYSVWRFLRAVYTGA
jgi:peptidoglycan/xylan/chitin deacetylase (PgdA/CDA1 family)